MHLDGRPWPSGLRSFGARIDGYRLAIRALRGVDLVWERHALGSRAMERLAGLLSVPRLVELNAPLSIEARWPGPESRRDRAREHAAMRSADRVFAVSRWLVRWAVEEVGCAQDRVKLLPNGVHSGRPGERERVRRDLGLSGPVLGYLGSMSRWQGADRIPEILDALGAPWQALVIGDGPCAPEPHPRLLRVGVAASGALPDLVSAFDVAIAPYRPTAPPWLCPLKLLEYRAQGVPTVAADIGDSRELLGEGGIVLPSEDASDWALAIRAALEAPRRPSVRSWERVAEEALAGW